MRQCNALKKIEEHLPPTSWPFSSHRAFLVFDRDDFFEVARHGPKTPNDVFFCGS